MKKLSQYIRDALGTDITPDPIPKSNLGGLPLYITETYRLYYADLFRQDFMLAEFRNADDFNVSYIEKHFRSIRDAFDKKVVLLADDLTSLNRKRLIEKGINFIIPGRQLYLPDFLVDLRERFQNPRMKRIEEKLLPSAQFILLYHILHRYSKSQIDQLTFKELAAKFGYTQMAISKAVENLKNHELCTVEGTKEKFIHFNEPIPELWHSAERLLVNPVLKRVFVDEKPENTFMLFSNASAIDEYSDVNASRQEYYAINKTTFYSLQQNNQLKNINDREGKYCIEVWKYNPEILVEELDNDKAVVDPLSLYLSLKGSHDERIEIALEQIIEKHIW